MASALLRQRTSRRMGRAQIASARYVVAETPSRSLMERVRLGAEIGALCWMRNVFIEVVATARPIARRARARALSRSA
jgi:hypothetical protein